MEISSNSGFLVKSLVNKNNHNSRNSYGIDMKLGPLSKMEKKNVIMSGKLDKTSCIKLSYHRYSLKLQSIWSNLEAKFQMHGPELQFFY